LLPSRWRDVLVQVKDVVGVVAVLQGTGLASVNAPNPVRATLLDNNPKSDRGARER